VNGEGNAPPDKFPGFWRRQFKHPVTRGQLVFDAFWGALLPLLLISYTFGSGRVDFGEFGEYSIYYYSEVTIGIASLGYYLIFRRAAAPLAGVLLAGGIFSLLLGLALLPFSIIGLCFGLIISILGFTPLITGFVFLRNARRCWSPSLQPSSRKHSAIRTIFVAAVVLIVPAIPELWANRIIESYPSP
jgi:hypothetical protein